MPDLTDITPVILTFNEAPNIARTLRALRWARRVVVLDSGSDDATRVIASSFPNVDVYSREFDSHSAQWNHALNKTKVDTEWVLALDADYIVSKSAVDWIAQFREEGSSAVSFPFKYAVNGSILRSGIYPRVTALFIRRSARYVQDGHTQRIIIEGAVARSNVHLVHDDRKPPHHWLGAQGRYASLEAQKLLTGAPGLRAWLRTHTPLTPVLVACHCLFLRGAILEGAAGWLYALQRMVAEGLICAAYQDLKMKNGADDDHTRP